MARTLTDAAIGTREARRRLQPRRKPYYRGVEQGLHLGYRKPKGRRGRPAPAGKWVLRRYVGGQAYQVSVLAAADDYSDANGKTILDFGQAQARARALLAGGRKSGPLTVRQALDNYYSKLEGEGRSAYDARIRIEQHILKIAGTKCDDLDSDTLRAWLRSIARAPARVRTSKGEVQRHRDLDHADPESVRRRQASANRIFTVLRAALNSAFHDGKIVSPGAWQRVKPFRQTDGARVRYLTVAEATRLINACDPEFRSLVRAALQTGCRYGELARLQVSDFNAASGTVAIRRSKAGKIRHTVLTEEGAVLFRQLSAGRNGDDVLIPRADGRRWAVACQGRPMAAACARANIRPRVSFHALRHTWASLSVMGGMPLMVVARNLGHADTRMVERHYGHLAPSYVADEVRRAAPRFGEIEPTNVTAIA
jgi:integrase